VQFGEPQAKLVNGTAATSASFTEPGDYILQAVVDDGSGESAGNFGYHCCWTNTQVKVSVKGRGTEVTGGDGGRREGLKSPAGTEVTYATDVAPIFQKRCQTCHHTGTSAPMSLVTYDEVRPWARSIRQRVASRDMPPWHLDKTVGIRHYKNDRSLSDEEIATIARWADDGALQGHPADMPPPLAFRTET